MTGEAVSIPAPVAGLNARDPVDSMGAADAIVLLNAFPQQNNVRSRRGFSLYATGADAPVETLFEWLGEAGERHLLAAAGDSVYFVNKSEASSAFEPDIEPEQSIEMLQIGSGFNSARWDYVNFNRFLIATTGVNVPHSYDGIDFGPLTYTGPTNPGRLNNVEAYKNRLYFSIDQDLWYGGVNEISGDLTRFPLGGQLKLGGDILWIKSWSQDTGSGLQDFLVIASEQGEILVYEGDYADATNWRLASRFYLPEPLKERSFMLLGADIAVLTKGGVVSLGQVFGQNEVTSTSIISDRIQRVFNDRARTVGRIPGWEGLSYSKGDFLLVNIPLSTGYNTGRSEQYVMNLLSGAWCKFEIERAVTWGLFDRNLYFGGNDGKVYLADVGNNDDGDPIITNITTAFSYLGDRERVKHFTMAKPLIRASGPIAFSVEVDVDFELTQEQQLIETTAEEGSLWNESAWDTFPWAGGERNLNDYYSVTGLGKSVAIKIESSTKDLAYQLSAIGLIFKRGGIL